MVTNKTDIVRFHRFAHHRRIWKSPGHRTIFKNFLLCVVTYRTGAGRRLISMHKIESREISKRKYLSKTILACRERQANKRQLKFGKPRFLFTKTHIPKTKTHIFYDKNNALFIYLLNGNFIIIIWNYGLNYLCNDYFKNDLEHMV